MKHIVIVGIICIALACLALRIAGEKSSAKQEGAQALKIEDHASKNSDEQYNEIVKSAEEYADQNNLVLWIGRIDQSFLFWLKNLPDDTKDIVIMSFGGYSQTGLQAAEYIRDKNIRVHIYGYCESACAELLLPAASELFFIDSPLIGFHGNTISDLFSVEKLSGDAWNYCNAVHAFEVRIFLTETIGRDNFWMDQLDHLETQSVSLKAIKTSKESECYLIDRKTKYDLWYPNLEQLRNQFGIEFDGSVCADDISCYDSKITAVSKSGKQYIVGQTPFMTP